MPENRFAPVTSYAFEARYPGPGEPVAEEEYKHAVDLAKAVVRWAESILEWHPT